MKYLFSFIITLPFLFNLYCINGFKPDLNKKAIENLYERIEDTSFWNKVHSLEFLADLGLNKEVDYILKDEFSKYEMYPQKRIGYWRCMAINERDSCKKSIYIRKILEAYLDPGSPDRIHAAESLAKLSFSLKKYPATWLINDTQNNLLEAYVNWSSVYPESSSMIIDYAGLFELLKSKKPEQRKIMAYGTKYLKRIDAPHWKELMALALKEPLDSPSAIYLLCGTYITCPTEERNSDNIRLIRDKLRRMARSNNKTNRYEAFVAMGYFVDKNDFNFIKDEFIQLNLINSLNNLDDETKDILSAISFAFLRTSGLIN